MIHQLYLKKALNIRREYNDIIHNINHYEKISKDLVKSLQDRLNELQSLLENINNKQVTDIDSAKEKLSVIMLSTELDINDVDKRIDGLNKRMDKLSNDEKTLYRELKEKYPEFSDDYLRNALREYISEN